MSKMNSLLSFLVKMLIAVAIVLLAGTLYWFLVVREKPTCAKQQHLDIKTEIAKGVTYKKNICYKDSKQGNCNLDIAYTTDKEKNPLIVLVHGGSWVQGERSDLNHLLFSLSAKGYTVATLDYDLVKYEEILEGDYENMYSQEMSVDAGIEYLVKHSKDYHIDTDKIVLLGESAAGQICGNLAERNADHPQDFDYKISGLIELYGMTDLKKLIYSVDENFSKGVSLAMMSFIFAGHENEDLMEEVEKVDFLYNVTDKLPPVLFIHGTGDRKVPISYSLKAYETLKELGVTTELVKVEGMGHYLSDQPVGDAIYTYMLEYMSE